MKITSVVHTAFALALLLLALPAVPAALAAPAAATADVQVAPPSGSQTIRTDSAPPRSEDETYSAEEIVQKAAGFFGATTEAVAKAVERIFSRYGRPNAYIAGQEGSGAFFVGLRYGEGDLYMKSATDRATKVYWQGPSIGFDFGANASKTFTLVYNLPNPEAIYERFPGIEGSAYFIAGIGVNYQQSGRVVLAPMRTGVGPRAGVNAGYLCYAKERNWIAF